MSIPDREVDVALLGAGVSGLWLLNELRGRGVNALLLSRGAPGGEQTLASQGMIHGGLKYSSAGDPLASQLAAMPALWRQCLRGEGPVDLRETRVRAQHTLMWSRANPLAGLTMRLAGTLLRSDARPADRGEVSAIPWAEPNMPVTSVADPVIDVSSLVRQLAGNFASDVLTCKRLQLLPHAPGGLLIDSGDWRVRARRLVLCAGAGNEDLLRQLGIRGPQMQRRPLRQVCVEHPDLPLLFGHELGASALPQLTITSETTAAGDIRWHIGGEPAERGAHMGEAETIALATARLRRTFRIDLDAARWSTRLVDRAEPRQAGSTRPGGPFCAEVGECGGTRIALCWPAKLTLAPALYPALAGFWPRQKGALAAAT